MAIETKTPSAMQTGADRHRIGSACKLPTDIFRWHPHYLGTIFLMEYVHTGPLNDSIHAFFAMVLGDGVWTV
jgi:hypothetical protein